MFDEAEVMNPKNTLTDLNEIKYENKNFLSGKSLQFDFI